MIIIKGALSGKKSILKNLSEGKMLLNISNGRWTQSITYWRKLFQMSLAPYKWQEVFLRVGRTGIFLKYQAGISLVSDTVVWTFMWRFIFSLNVNVLLQTSHENDFSPEWVILCLVRWLSLENCLPHTSHSNGFSPVWILH